MNLIVYSVSSITKQGWTIPGALKHSDLYLLREMHLKEKK